MASNATYGDSLGVLMKQIATMKGLADANLPFLIELETMVISEIRSPERQMQEAGLLPPGQGMPGDPMGGALGGMPPGMPPGGDLAAGLPPELAMLAAAGGGPGGVGGPEPSFAGAGVPGAGPQQAPPPANPDELRRVLTA